MRLIFLGSGAFGLETLKCLHDDHAIAAVVSSPDKPSGRKRKLTPTPIAAWAQGVGLQVIKTDDVNDAATVDRLANFQPDAAVVIAFGQKLGPPLVDALGGLCVNLHASLLPKYRGAAPINWAIINGESETGLSVISLAQRMDAGLIYAQGSTQIDPLETAGQLHDRLAQMGPGIVADVLDRFEAGALQGQTQDESRSTRAPKLAKSDGTVNFAATAREIRCRIHGLTPWPGVRVNWLHDGQTTPLTLLRVRDEDLQGDSSPGTILEGFRVATGQGVVRLLDVQTPGGKPMTIEDFARGHAMTVGDRLGP